MGKKEMTQEVIRFIQEKFPPAEYQALIEAIPLCLHGWMGEKILNKRREFIV